MRSKQALKRPTVVKKSSCSFCCLSLPRPAGITCALASCPIFEDAPGLENMSGQEFEIFGINYFGKASRLST
jgi:hypothetical protein